MGFLFKNFLMESPTRELLNAMQTKPVRKRPRCYNQFQLKPSQQNVDQKPDYTLGDPNSETDADYDFIWLIWILNKILPKDIVTHFVRTTGGFSFGLHWKGFTEGIYEIRLNFWKERDFFDARFCREIYFNVPIHSIERKKNHIYVHHQNGKIYRLTNE
jgi:hypothetical protein